MAGAAAVAPVALFGLFATPGGRPLFFFPGAGGVGGVEERWKVEEGGGRGGRREGGGRKEEAGRRTRGERRERRARVEESMEVEAGSGQGVGRKERCGPF